MAKVLKINVEFTAYATLRVNEEDFKQWVASTLSTPLEELSAGDRANAIEQFANSMAWPDTYHMDYSGKHSYVCVMNVSANGFTRVEEQDEDDRVEEQDEDDDDDE